jgi:hypothetical protein
MEEISASLKSRSAITRPVLDYLKDKWRLSYYPLSTWLQSMITCWMIRNYKGWPAVTVIVSDAFNDKCSYDQKARKLNSRRPPVPGTLFVAWNAKLHPADR